MVWPVDRDDFVSFLLVAKKNTYAAEGGVPVPALLPGSKQLEYAGAGLLYRDVYFGGDYFAGQETVYYRGQPIWSMTYAGGRIGEPADIAGVYGCLRAALRAVPAAAPYRGPETFQLAELIYANEVHGEPDRFWGVETITRAGVAVYDLRYCGGLLE